MNVECSNCVQVLHVQMHPGEKFMTIFCSRHCNAPESIVAHTFAELNRKFVIQ